MPDSNKAVKSAKSKSRSASNAGRIDILFGGPLLFVPTITDGNITGLTVYSPCNGHPVGARFFPKVWFTDAQLNDPECAEWPDPEDFSLLDPHGYVIDIQQDSGKAGSSFPDSKIPGTNYRVSPGRHLTADWEVAIAVQGKLSNWTSHRLTKVTDDLYHGGDAPTTETTAAMHRLSFSGVTGADFCGAAREPREYLRANAATGGTLIVLGEIPYQPTLLHERKAVEALAKLAGLDLHLAATDPTPHSTRLLGHKQNCGLSAIVA